MKLRVYDHLLTSHCSPPAGLKIIKGPGRFHQLEELLPIHLTVAVKVKLFDVTLHLVRLDARLVERLRRMQCGWQGSQRRREMAAGGGRCGAQR